MVAVSFYLYIFFFWRGNEIYVNSFMYMCKGRMVEWMKSEYYRGFTSLYVQRYILCVQEKNFIFIYLIGCTVCTVASMNVFKHSVLDFFLDSIIEAEELSEASPPFGCCNQRVYVHLQAVCQQRSNAVDQVGYPPCLESWP